MCQGIATPKSISLGNFITIKSNSVVSMHKNAVYNGIANMDSKSVSDSKSIVVGNAVSKPCQLGNNKDKNASKCNAFDYILNVPFRHLKISSTDYNSLSSSMKMQIPPPFDDHSGSFAG